MHMMSGKRELMRVQRHDWWVTPVWEVETPFDSKFNDCLLQEIDEFFKDNHTNSYDLNIWDCSGRVIQELKEYTLDSIKQLTQEYISANYSSFKYWHTRGWLNINKPGTGMPIHGHGGNKIAMTYYIKSPKDSGDLLLIDPRGAIDWDMGVENINGTKYKRITAKEGKLVFFPAYILHMVEENKSNLDRISLTSNLSTLDDATVSCISKMVTDYVSKTKV